MNNSFTHIHTITDVESLEADMCRDDINVYLMVVVYVLYLI